MEYKLKDDGTKPSITKLLDLLNKPALLKWANQIGLEGTRLDDYRAKSRSQGTDYHDQIDRYLKFATPCDDPDFHFRVTNFFAGCEIIDSEKSVEHKLFVGRYDVKFRKAGEVFICDFKSSKRKLYLENMLQLVAYKMAAGCDRIGIVSIPDMTAITVPKELNYSHYEEIIKHLAAIYQLKKRTI